jgi:S1-C subfamily serine protease
MGRAIASLLGAAAFLLSAQAFAGGPFGSIHVGTWSGGAYTDDANGAFSHCAASSTFESGIALVVGQSASGTWFLSFAHPSWQFIQGETIPIDVTFGGQAQFHLFGTPANQILMTAVVPSAAVIDQLRKSHLMVAVSKGHTFQFYLASTGQLIPVIANCTAKVKANGIAAAGDFSLAVAKSPQATAAQPAAAGASAPKRPSRPAKTIDVSGTGFGIGPSGYLVTNYHVINGCIGDIRGNLPSQSAVTLRIVSTDETNDLALLQAPSTFKSVATIRGTAIHPGDPVIAIGFPLHDLLTSDFTVTTGVVSSLSGILNDTRYLQISAPIQAGSSGGPLLDASGNLVGVAAAGLNALKFAKLSGGDVPQNVNFAIKTGAVRDFLDNSAVPYSTGESGPELKTSDVAANARAYTMLITCTAATEKE